MDQGDATANLQEAVMMLKSFHEILVQDIFIDRQFLFKKVEATCAYHLGFMLDDENVQWLKVHPLEYFTTSTQVRPVQIKIMKDTVKSFFDLHPGQTFINGHFLCEKGLRHEDRQLGFVTEDEDIQWFLTHPRYSRTADIIKVQTSPSQNHWRLICPFKITLT